MPMKEFDVVVLGTGAAGMVAALGPPMMPAPEWVCSRRPM